MSDERKMLEAYINARRSVDELEDDLKAAKLRRDEAENTLIEYLRDQNMTQSGKYDDLGRVRVNKPRVYASSPKENEEELFGFLKSIGEDSSIKLSVHPQTLHSIVARCIENGTELPPFVSYYLKQTLTLEGV